MRRFSVVIDAAIIVLRADSAWAPIVVIRTSLAVVTFVGIAFALDPHRAAGMAAQIPLAAPAAFFASLPRFFTGRCEWRHNRVRARAIVCHASPPKRRPRNLSWSPDVCRALQASVHQL